MRKIALTVSVLMIAGMASALTLVQTNEFSGTPSYNRNLTFDKFDDNGGLYTLNSITMNVTLTTLAGATLQIDNEDETPSSGTVFLGSTGSLSSEDVNLGRSDYKVFSVSSLSSKYMTLAVNDGDDPDSIQTDGEDYDILTTIEKTDTDTGSIAPALFTAYIGTDTYDLKFSASQYTDFSALGGVSYGGTPVETSGSVEVIYNYTIPEPASALIIGIFAAAIFIRRRFSDRIIKR